MSDNVYRAHSSQQEQINGNDYQERGISNSSSFPSARVISPQQSHFQYWSRRKEHRSIFQLASGGCRMPCALVQSFLIAQGSPWPLAWPQSNRTRRGLILGRTFWSLSARPLGHSLSRSALQIGSILRKEGLLDNLYCVLTLVLINHLNCASTQVVHEQVIN